MKLHKQITVIAALIYATYGHHVMANECIIPPYVANVPTYETIYDETIKTKDVIDDKKKKIAEEAVTSFNKSITAWYSAVFESFEANDAECSKQILLTWANRRDFLKSFGLWFVSENAVQQAQNEVMWKFTGVMVTYATYVRPHTTASEDRMITLYLNEVFDYYLKNVERRWGVNNGRENNLYTWSRMAMAAKAYLNNEYAHHVKLKQDLDKILNKGTSNGIFATFPHEDSRGSRAARYHQLNTLGIFWMQVLYARMSGRVYTHGNIPAVYFTARQLMEDWHTTRGLWNTPQVWVSGTCNPQYALRWVFTDGVPQDNECINYHAFGNMGLMRDRGFIPRGVLTYIRGEVDEYAARHNY